MTRDQIKDRDYFNEYIEFQNSTIEEFNELMETVIQERGVDDEGVMNGYIALSGYHLNRLIAMYSAGHPLQEIKDILPQLIDLMEKTWGPDAIDSYDDYAELVWLLSIGTMLEIDDIFMSRLNRLAKTYEQHDVLIDFLLNARHSAQWQPHQKSFLFGYPYNSLEQTIGTELSEQRVQSLKSYLENDWYKGHKDTGWYDTHLHQDNIYQGYWSFESGAIVKILGLDDSSLKDVPYYPYDMVHYKG